jgi:hypothetical protein
MLAARGCMAAVLLVLFAVTFLFDTRIGFCFLAAAIVKLYLGATSRRMKAVGRSAREPEPPAWKNPWGPSS